MVRVVMWEIVNVGNVVSNESELTDVNEALSYKIHRFEMLIRRRMDCCKLQKILLFSRVLEKRIFLVVVLGRVHSNPKPEVSS